MVFFINGLFKGFIAARAASISFNFFLAMFPTLVFFFTIIPYILIENFQEVADGLYHRFPPAFGGCHRGGDHPRHRDPAACRLVLRQLFPDPLFPDHRCSQPDGGL
ncbi:MAG: YihY/virulence factor BrkB family protein [Marinilabiliales bacterium]|nr:YihY/virulence factor BrkB family protein [Marinilabiliales bacterium]